LIEKRRGFIEIKQLKFQKTMVEQVRTLRKEVRGK